MAGTLIDILAPDLLRSLGARPQIDRDEPGVEKALDLSHRLNVAHVVAEVGAAVTAVRGRTRSALQGPSTLGLSLACCRRISHLLHDERSVPRDIAGKYRLIDVPISNCLNSGCLHLMGTDRPDAGRPAALFHPSLPLRGNPR